MKMSWGRKPNLCPWMKCLKIIWTMQKYCWAIRLNLLKPLFHLAQHCWREWNAMDAQIFYSGTQNVSCALAGATNRCYANIDLAGGNDFEFHRNHVSAMVFIQVDEVNGGGFDLNGFHGLVTGGYVYPYANATGLWSAQQGLGVFRLARNSLSDNGFYPNHKWESLPGRYYSFPWF